MTSHASKATRAVRASIESDTQHGAVVPPLHLSSNFAFEGFGQQREYDYTRSGNPTRDALANALAELEGGAGAVVTASGMGALMLLTQFLKPGDTIIAPHDCYGGTYRLFEQQSLKGLFEVEFVDQTEIESLRSICTKIRPSIILTESPAGLRKPASWRRLTPRKLSRSSCFLALRCCVPVVRIAVCSTCSRS